MGEEAESLSTLDSWTETVCRELGITDAVDPGAATTTVLDIARDVAHGVTRTAAPLTTFLLGVAAGRAADPITAVSTLAAEVRRLVEGWDEAAIASRAPAHGFPFESRGRERGS
jgi:Domain of unknown function (DUF6457)